MILVTGATGFIGSMLVESLLKKGEKVAILCRNTEKARKAFPKARVIEGDITQNNIAIGKVGKVAHLAGMVSYSKSKKELYDVNVNGTNNIIDACIGAKKFVFASSVSVMSPARGVTTEKTPCKPITPYGETKLEAEELVRNSGIPNAILRFAPVYGKESAYWLKNLKLLERRFPIPDVKTMTHVLHVSNAVQAIELALKRGNGTYLIADKKPIKFVEFASMIFRLLGTKPNIAAPQLVSMMARLVRKADYLRILTMNRQYDISKAGKELGYRPTGNLRKDLKEMIDWYKKEKDKTTVREKD